MDSAELAELSRKIAEESVKFPRCKKCGWIHERPFRHKKWKAMEGKNG